MADFQVAGALSRREIADFATSPAAVRAFEQLQQQASVQNPADIAAAQASADSAATAATSAAADAAAAQGQADAAVAGLAGKQDLDAGLSSLAALTTALGLVEQTAAQLFGVRQLGVAGASDVPTRADADARYVQQDNGPTFTAPTGALSRAALASYTAPTISAAYAQAEVQGIANALQALSQAVVAVITDLRANGALTG